MSDPSLLPLEIFDQILRSIQYNHFDAEKKPYRCLEHFAQQSKQLFACSLVNRRWHRHSNPHLYARFSFDLGGNSSQKLWHFLRTVLEIPEYAAHVRTFHYQDQWIHEKEIPKIANMFSKADLTLVLNGFRSAGLQNGETELIAQHRHVHRSEYLNLIMANLPNLTMLKAGALKLSKHHALFEASEKQAFRTLRDVTFGRVETIWRSASICAEHLIPFFQLPTLRKMTIFYAYSDPQSTHSDALETHASTSPVTDLTLVYSRYHLLCLADARALLQLPKSLKSLSLNVKAETFNFENPSPGPDDIVTLPDFGDILMQHSDCLEYLDLFWEASSLQDVSSPKDPLGVLQKFTRLKTLYIDIHLIMGLELGEQRHVDWPVCLNETLPPTLESLVLYGLYDYWNYQDIEPFLTDLVQSPRHHELRSIMIEEFSEGRKCSLDSTNTAALKQICADKGVTFQIVKCNQLPQGGARRTDEPADL
ncbi:uncharacterized protein KY384_006679 [Bacidia gigantensis]|uniref:uncharacterized protein n=1 Tax=Bacidia gigantensis TaxID=2732470 RepID=UPI001D05526A|nr:uncharacterized protein KY384_006679 [Bacidia gigantensis]KAG8528990.1 hypothetical protein KY384_006679 [Bacidia gigantensis]